MDNLNDTVDLARRLRDGDERAATLLFERFSQRVRNLADRKLNPRLQVRVGPDTILTSVLYRALVGIRDGKYAIEQSGDLWRLLFQITLTTVKQKAAHHTRQKRSYRKEIAMSDEGLLGDLLDGRRSVDEDSFSGLSDVLADLLTRCKERTRHAVTKCLEGHTVAETAVELRCSRWTVKRDLDQFGELLKQRLDAAADKDPAGGEQ